VNFETFNFHPRIMAGVQALGYTTPTLNSGHFGDALPPNFRSCLIHQAFAQ
jgi:hypothetical protein